MEFEKEDQSIDAPILHRTWSKIITGSRGRDLERIEEGEEKMEDRTRYWKGQKRSTEGQ